MAVVRLNVSPDFSVHDDGELTSDSDGCTLEPDLLP
jgi:hypothetical protein